MVGLSILALALVPSISATPSGMRSLLCRGKPDIDLRITGRPSPANPKMVRMTLRYVRSGHRIGDNYQNLLPGECTWNPQQISGVPVEPGVVHFDIPGQAQDWFATRTRQMDTTYLAAAFHPDTISLPRYLTRSELYWRFYVDDQTNMSISFGAYNNPTKLPTYVTVTGPIGQTTPPPSTPGVAAKKPGAASKTSATAKLAKLTFKGVDRYMNGFSVRFSARPGAAATVDYSTDAPARTPSGWYFPGSAVQGSGAVSRGGIGAQVTETKRGPLFSDYVGATRIAPQRGTPYNFIITVQGAGGETEQYAGKLTSMRIDVSASITDYNVTRKSFDQGVELAHDLYCETSGVFVRCDGKNVAGRIGILAYARPNFGPRDAGPQSWNALPGKNSGVGKISFDTRTMRPDRTVQSFTIRSMEGDVEFEAHGQLTLRRY